MAPCDEIRALREDVRRGTASPAARDAVAAHLAACPGCRRAAAADDALAAALQALPRPAAPAALRRAAEAALAAPAPGPGGARPGPARPWAAALAAAALVLALLTPWLRGPGRPGDDPVDRLVQAGVAEHRRILLQLEAGGPEVGDPRALLDRVRTVADVPVPPALAGTGTLRLLGARPTVVADRKAAAASLREAAAPVTTCFVLAGRDLRVPERERVQIEQYRPFLRRVGDYHVVYWKQGDLAYLLVSGLDEPQTRQLFLRVRRAL
jgi:anti-sigma factor RsiW